MKLIVAVNNNGTIGQHGKLAWKCKADMLHFKKLTTENPVFNTLIVGKKTAEGLLGVKWQNRRVKIVGGNDGTLGNIVARAFYDELEFDGTAWVIGGAEIYNLLVHLCDEIHISHINDDTEGDTKWEIPANYRGKVVHYNFEIDDDNTKTRAGGEAQQA